MNEKKEWQTPMLYHKIAVSFPITIYQKILDRARADKVSFSDKAVELIECGLFDYEEAERHEEAKPPYGEWCRNPEACKGKGYCPLDPTCGD